MKRLLLALLISTLLTGCATKEYITKYRMPPVAHPSYPRPLDLSVPRFFVVSPDNRVEFLANIEKINGGVFFALTPADYEVLAGDFQEIQRYIRQQKDIIEYYRALLSAETENSDISK